MRLTLFSTALGLVGSAHAQDFVPNCTWQSANITGSYLGMYCNDDNWSSFNYVWSWLNLDLCLTNNGGQLWEQDTGDFSTSCRDCSWVGSDLSVDLYFNLSCLCFDPQSNIKNSTYNLNRLLWNHNGHLGCFGHSGNTSACPDPACTCPGPGCTSS